MPEMQETMYWTISQLENAHNCSQLAIKLSTVDSLQIIDIYRRAELVEEPRSTPIAKLSNDGQDVILTLVDEIYPDDYSGFDWLNLSLNLGIGFVEKAVMAEIPDTVNRKVVLGIDGSTKNELPDLQKQYMYIGLGIYNSTELLDLELVGEIPDSSPDNHVSIMTPWSMSCS